MQISGLPASSTFGAADVLAIEVDGKTYKLTGATLAAALESIGSFVTTDDVATTTADGLMSATDKSKLNGIAAGAQVNTITGVKGGAESSYRTGQINLTPANIGAADLTTLSLTDAAMTFYDDRFTVTRCEFYQWGKVVFGFATISVDASDTAWGPGYNNRAECTFSGIPRPASGYVVLSVPITTNGTAQFTLWQNLAADFRLSGSASLSGSQLISLTLTYLT